MDIVIVEDSLTQAERLKYTLEEQGFRVWHARNGQEALQLINSCHPGVVISDVIMPEMDGFELCKRIKSEPSMKETPVILLTVLSDPRDVIRSLECGADNFITKPYDEENLLARIQYFLTQREQESSTDNDSELDILIGGQKYSITADRKRILNILISTYETVVQKNRDLLRTQQELRILNEHLENRVQERTRKLMEEITRRKQVEDDLRRQEQDLRIKSQNLEEVNTALHVLIKNREIDRIDQGQKILSNCKELILPYVEQLKKQKLPPHQMACVEIIEANVQNIISPFLQSLSSELAHLTPKEVQVANLVKEGKTTKEISELLNLSIRSVESHRDNIRTKLGISNEKINLRSYLLSLS
ncbi:MAG: Transcriptional activator protein CzcR [Syntrophus sp. PtaB.Bin001]|jgi:DNA-binding NarL/FixJ family response regulator|nr:MAG: Transcriptional activator protein CzcR [Syntrophus sp. PtaB.Bin001]